MKFSFFILFLIFWSTASSQSFTINLGTNYLYMYDSSSHPAYAYSNYTSDIGYSVGLSLDNINLNGDSLLLILTFSKNSGYALGRDGGRGGGSSVEVDFEKYELAIGFFPYIFKPFKKLHVMPGICLTGLIGEKFRGQHIYGPLSSSTVDNLEDTRKSFNSYGLFGIAMRFNYPIHLKKTIVWPYYEITVNVNGEFKSFPQNTRSIRMNLGIGVNI